MTLLCIIPGPSHLYATEPDERPTRWCFTCRKHVPHTWELVGDPPPRNYQFADWQELVGDPPPRNYQFADWQELDGYAASTIVMPSYYDPSWTLRCPARHSDTYFPGCGPL